MFELSLDILNSMPSEKFSLLFTASVHCEHYMKWFQNGLFKIGIDIVYLFALVWKSPTFALSLSFTRCSQCCIANSVCSKIFAFTTIGMRFLLFESSNVSHVAKFWMANSTSNCALSFQSEMWKWILHCRFVAVYVFYVDVWIHWTFWDILGRQTNWLNSWISAKSFKLTVQIFSRTFGGRYSAFNVNSFFLKTLDF